MRSNRQGIEVSAIDDPVSNRNSSAALQALCLAAAAIIEYRIDYASKAFILITFAVILVYFTNYACPFFPRSRIPWWAASLLVGLMVWVWPMIAISYQEAYNTRPSVENCAAAISILQTRTVYDLSRVPVTFRTATFPLDQILAMPELARFYFLMRLVRPYVLLFLLGFGYLSRFASSRIEKKEENSILISCAILVTLWLCCSWVERATFEFSPMAPTSRDVAALTNATSADQTATTVSHITNSIFFLERRVFYDFSAIVSHCVWAILVRLLVIRAYRSQLVVAILFGLCAFLLYTFIWEPTDDGLSSFSPLWHPLVREKSVADELTFPQSSPSG